MPLTLHTDLSVVAKAMARPDSGLEIRDRMWLKITIPHAFIGKIFVVALPFQILGYVWFIGKPLQLPYHPTVIEGLINLLYLPIHYQIVSANPTRRICSLCF